MSSSNTTSSASEISGLTNIAEGQVGLGNIDITNAGNIIGKGDQVYDPAYAQYVSGITGQMTPAQQALVTENLGAMNTKTEGTYGGLGLGGSTMESQDLASNQLKTLAEESNINFGNETVGLEGLSQADQFYNTGANYLNAAEGAYGGASTSTYDAGNLANANLSALNSAISSLGSKSSSGSGLSSLFGGAGGSGLASLFGSGSSGGSVATAAADVIPAFA